MVIVIIINKKIDIMKWMKKRQLRRNKNKFKRISLAFLGLVIILAGALFLFWPKGTTSVTKNNDKQTSSISTSTSNSSISDSGKQVIYPTIYISGSSGDVLPIDWLFEGLLPIKNVSAQKSLVITSNIAKNYELKVGGQISQDNQYPLIEFGTVKGTDSGALFSAGLQKAIRYLTENYQVPWINLVGYSSGATGAIYYMIDTANKSNFPPVNKYLSLDGEYNKETSLQFGETLTDVLKNGPLVKTAMYQYIAENYNKIPAKIQMLLLEGDFDSNKQTDSAIPWADSFSIYHLFKKNGNEITTTLYPTTLRHGQDPRNPIAVKYIKNFIYNTP
nr:alpha/beta hydrolase [Lactococcus lactis]